MDHQDGSPPRFRSSSSNRTPTYNGSMPKSATPTSSSTTVTTHLQNIKEEETSDDELTQIDRSSPRVLGRISSTSSSSSNIDLQDNLDMLHDMDKSTTNLSLSTPNLHEEMGIFSDKGNSKEELALLPPLPHTGELEIAPQFDINEAIFEQDNITYSSRLETDDVIANITSSTQDAIGEAQDFATISRDHNMSTNGNSELSDVILDRQTSFDLSKALEMTSHSKISNIINNLGSEGRTLRTPVSVSTFKPCASSPTSEEYEENTTTTSSSSDHAATIQYDSNKILNPVPVSSSLYDQKQSNISSRERSRSNSSTLVSTLRDTIISGLPQNSTVVERKLSRKLSNRSRKNTMTFEERLQKSPSLSTENSSQYGMTIPAENTNFQTQKTSTPVSSSQAAVTHQPESGLRDEQKKMPFLRRASSALLRKTSAGKNGYSMTRMNTSTLSTAQAFESGSTNNQHPSSIRRSADIENKLPRRRLSCSRSYVHLDADPKFVNCSRPSKEASRTISNDVEQVYRKTSLGSKIRRGFTRILSDSNNSREALSPPPKEVATVGPPASPLAYLSTAGSNPILPKPKENNRVSIDSATTVNRTATSLPSSSTDTIPPLREETQANTSKLSTSRRVLSRNPSKKNALFEQETEIYLDKEALQNFVPVLSITEDTHHMNRSSLQMQSAIGLCIDNLRNKEGMKLDLKEYVGILNQQQRKEDERYAILEKRFLSCTWCSDKDLQYLKKKRISVNKIWSDYVQFYREKLNNP
ncbi:YOL036W [Saccharomyces arboricola H-6]|uniref:YOL036W n=1 Tax=Saccharomyces arboricola (strain H-6 / AS 2.3317 / CBS 10644) TaxID=1160507 RepID=J8LIB9_SACAR|nr:YOL036W [Saccharomyces arboricola H-6]